MLQRVLKQRCHLHLATHLSNHSSTSSAPGDAVTMDHSVMLQVCLKALRLLRQSEHRHRNLWHCR
jgi:hypothetical protein